MALILILSLTFRSGTLAQVISEPLLPDTGNNTISQVARFLSEYVALESLPGNERTAGRFFAEECRIRGLHVQVLTDLEHSYNFIASLYPLDHRKPNIVMLNHIDIVEPGDPENWTYPPFSGAIADGAVWGRGSIDNKGMAAMQLEALSQFVELARTYDLPFNVSILAVSGEEIGGSTGAAVVVDRFLNDINPIVVLGEGGTGMDGIFRSKPDKVLYGIEINQKRLLWLRLTLELSSPGHGSVPTSQNANVVMVEALQRLNNRPRRLQLTSATRIMFSEMGQHETGLTALALRRMGFFKPIVGPSLRKEPIMQALMSNTVNLTRISNPPGSLNQVSQKVEAILDCRLLPETDTDDFIRSLRRILANDDIKIEVIEETERAKDTRPDVFFTILENAIKKNHPGAEVAPILFPATNDNNYFRSRGIATYGLLPVHLSRDIISSIHNFNERFTLRELNRGVAVYTDFLEQIFSSALSPADLTQTVRGRLVDQYLDIPLADGLIVITNEEGAIQATKSGLTGSFRMNSVPIGRYTIKVFADGYEEVTLSNVVVQTGWEQVLRIGLDETTHREQLRPLIRRLAPQNEMASVSARPFDAEESGRYPGSRADPARMVPAFAGVRSTYDSRNDMIVRGNAPFGLVWRLENIDVPNPNHFAITGTSGGGVNILNNKLLDRSDFYTGAFPAEYGNALAGVFDLQMRIGNDQKHEFGFETGSLATEATAQGPIGPRGGSSYIFSYRHSSLGMLSSLGVPLDYSKTFGVDAIPYFGDVALKLNFPISNRSSLSLFGIGGDSRIFFNSDRRHHCSFSYRDYGKDVKFESQMGMGGVRYQHNFDPATSYKVTLYTTYQGRNSDHIWKDSTLLANKGHELAYWNRSRQHNFGTSFRLYRRMDAQNDLRLGLVMEQFRYDFKGSLEMEPLTDSRDATGLVRSFIQWRHRFSNNLSISTGVHGMFFHLNESWAVDPRLGLSWQITPRRSIHIGAGFHSQLQPLYIYFLMDPEGNLPNKNLDLSLSQHYVVGYTNAIAPHIRLRLEAFYQNLTGIPVEQQPSSWSMLNQGLDFKLSFPGPLQNKGTGQNYGVEFSLERLFNRGYYYLVTATVYDSRYTGSDGVRRHTDFNGNYIFNAVTGKEWDLRRGRALGVSLRSTLAGGRRFSPIDLEASRDALETVIVDSAAYSLQFKDYFRTDLRITYRKQLRRVSHEIGLDLLNIIPLVLPGRDFKLPEDCRFFGLSTRNVHSISYNPLSDNIVGEYQLGFLPILYYRIKF